MKTATIFLVIATVSHGCKIDSVDRAQHQFIPMQNLAVCEELAAALDSQIGQRAFCWETPND